MPQDAPRMGKVGLTIWLALPVLIIAGLALMVDRKVGKPDPRLSAIEAARLPGQDPATGRDLASIERERAETQARIAAQNARSAPPVPDAAPAETPLPPEATADPDPFRRIEVAAGTLRRLQVSGGVPAIIRDLLVWLPPSYDDTQNRTRRYPVLYLLDGQTVFEPQPGRAGEWRADEAAAALIREGAIEPVIIVGVPSFAASREAEYAAGTPASRAFVEFLAGEVKTRVDAAFRTKLEASNAAIGGAGPAAAIAVEAALRRSDAFGAVLAESPPLIEDDRRLFRDLGAAEPLPSRIYVGAGGKEGGGGAAGAGLNEQRAGAVSALGATLRAKGLGPDRLKVVFDPAAAADERAWAARLPEALRFLFPPG